MPSISESYSASGREPGGITPLSQASQVMAEKKGFGGRRSRASLFEDGFFYPPSYPPLADRLSTRILVR
jgi:hypothetical protein